MKSLRITVLLLSLVFTLAWADSNTVASANILGYTKITIPSNQYMLVTLNFNNESNTVDGLFGSLPIGTIVYFWDTGTQNYHSISKGRAGWGASGTNVIMIGSGAFVKLPVNVQTTLLLSGTVPSAESTPLYKANGYSLVAYPYPVEMKVTNTVLAKSASAGDFISIWDNGWITYSKGRAGWTTAENVKIKIGQAFFYRSYSNSIVNEPRPYTLD